MGKDIVENVELNLGPYNHCVDVVPQGCDAEYPCDFYFGLKVADRAVVCSSSDGVFSRTILSDKFITVPTFTVAIAIEEDTPANRLKLISAVELKILSMIYAMADNLSVDIFRLENIVIPIKQVQFVKSDSKEALRLIADVGICVFEMSSGICYVLSDNTLECGEVI